MTHLLEWPGSVLSADTLVGDAPWPITQGAELREQICEEICLILPCDKGLDGNLVGPNFAILFDSLPNA